MSTYYRIYGRIGEQLPAECLEPGELFWDAQEQCPYLVVDKKPHLEQVDAHPLMPHGEVGGYCYDHTVYRFSLARNKELPAEAQQLIKESEDYAAKANRLNQHTP